MQEHFSFLFNDVVIDGNLLYHLDVENMAKKGKFLSSSLHEGKINNVCFSLYWLKLFFWLFSGGEVTASPKEI